MKIGQTVVEMITNDQEGELGAVRAYNEAAALAREVGDQASVDLLTKTLKMEEGHEDWAEVQRSQIQQMGLGNYLTNQTKGAAE
jgi:bacterioferritin